MGSRFWDLLGKSVLISGFVVIVVVSTTCYLAITRQEIPDVLANAMALILGYFFANAGINTGHRLTARK